MSDEITLLEGMLAPAVGRVEGKKDNRVVWTSDAPQSMVAVWNDDDPEGVQLMKMPDPQQNGSGTEQPAMDGLAQEAMKKPVQSNDTTKE